MKKLFFVLAIGGALVATSCGKKCTCTSPTQETVEVNLNDYKLLGVKMYNDCKEYQNQSSINWGGAEDYTCK